MWIVTVDGELVNLDAMSKIGMKHGTYAPKWDNPGALSQSGTLIYALSSTGNEEILAFVPAGPTRREEVQRTMERLQAMVGGAVIHSPDTAA